MSRQRREQQSAQAPSVTREYTMRLSEAPLAPRRSAPARRWVFLLACLAALLPCGRAADVTADLALSKGENNLGRLTRACSSYCEPGVDGLDLWMSLKEVCSTSDSDSFLRQMARGQHALQPLRAISGPTTSSFSNHPSTAESGWPVFHSILVCSAISLFGLFAGFTMGSKLASAPKDLYPPLL